MDAEAQPWTDFVLANGWRARSRDLAAVIGVDRARVESVRRTGACAKLARPLGFGELFALWHGRPPSDEDWPPPQRPGSNQYEWQTPEIALLASLVGRLGPADIAAVLTRRLRVLSGDDQAERTKAGVLSCLAAIGMQTSDVVGGITVAEAGRESGSNAQIYNAFHHGDLTVRWVGRLQVIPHDQWATWKARRVAAPDGYIRLSELKQPLGIRSDKLSEWARAGYVPTATRCKPFGVAGPSTQYGTWYVDKKVADQLIADRRAGKAMPWHGRPMSDNLGVTYRLWCERRHPAACTTCATLWGPAGAPSTKEDYAARYPTLAHGAKRHLTMKWAPGLTVAEVAAASGAGVRHVRRAIANGVLAGSTVNGVLRVTRTDATRWKGRNCPSGDSEKSWVSLDTASKQFMFTVRELKAFIVAGRLTSREGSAGAQRGIVYVPRHQCASLRERIGFSEEEAARRVGVPVERLSGLLEGLRWRTAAGIPLTAVQAAIKRLQSREGFTFEEAAATLGVPVAWVKARKRDGTVRVLQARWDRRRQYLSEPMMKRLREALRRPEPAERALDSQWLLLGEAAQEAGVCTTTIGRWVQDGELASRTGAGRARYHREAVRARAKVYWQSRRFLRAVPPAWLQQQEPVRTGLQYPASSRRNAT